MADLARQALFTRDGQSQWLHRALVQEALVAKAQYLGALEALLRDEPFAVVVRYWVQVLYLHGEVTVEGGVPQAPEEGLRPVGKRRRAEQAFVERLLRDLREVGLMQRQLEARGGSRG